MGNSSDPKQECVMRLINRASLMKKPMSQAEAERICYKKFNLNKNNSKKK